MSGKVPFSLGNGETIELVVTGFADGYPRGVDSTCAFCFGDPCNEYSADVEVARKLGYEIPAELTEAPIAIYYRNAPYSCTCPVCDGRPT